MVLNTERRPVWRKCIVSVLSLLLVWSLILPAVGYADPQSGTGWTSIDGGGIGTDNSNQQISSNDPHAVLFNNQLYVIFQEQGGMTWASTIRVMKWEGGEWHIADGGTALNVNSDMNGSSPSLAVYNGELYAIWEEEIVSYPQMAIYVKKLQGDTWVSVTGGSTPLNGQPGSYTGRLPVLQGYNGHLYAAWVEGSETRKVTIKKYNGVEWTSETGMNSIKPDGTAWSPEFAVYNNELFLTWSEQLYMSPYSYYLPVSKRSADGSWVNVSGAEGISGDNTKVVGVPQLQAYNGLLYVVWRNDSGYKIKAYDGTGWSPVGDGTIPSVPGIIPQGMKLTVFHNKLFAAWVNYNPIAFPMKVTAAFYDGTNWVPAYSGLETTESNSSVDALVSTENQLYMFWGNFKVRASVYREGPPAPTGVQVVRSGQDSAELSWTVESGVTEYKVYMGTEPGTYSPLPLITLAGTEGSYTITGLEEGKTYYIAVKASNADGDSSYSAEVSVHIPEPAPALTGFTWVTGSTPGTIRAAQLPGAGTYKYAIGFPGALPQPMVGDDASTYYTQSVLRNVDLAMYSGRHFFAVEVDSSNRIVKWAEIPIDDDLIAEAAPPLTGLTWGTGSVPGTTKAAQLPDEGTFKYAVGAAGSYAQPVMGADASQLGYTLPLTTGGDIPVTSGQHIFVAEVDGNNQIVKWTDYTITEDHIAKLAPAITGFTWSTGTAAGTTRAALPPGDGTYKYAVGAAGAYTQPLTGTDAESLGYTQALVHNGNIAVTSGQHIYVIEVDSSNRIAKWSDTVVADEQIAVSAPVLTNFVWTKGSAPGTTKAVQLPDDGSYKYAIGTAGAYTQPVVGADAAELGYAQTLMENSNIAVTNSQHLYVVEVDSSNRIIKWADITVVDDQIAAAAPAIVGLTWGTGSVPGTTKAAQLPGSGTFKYAIGAAGAYVQPIVGDDAAELGYTQEIVLHDDISVTSGQHLFVVEVDAGNRIEKWANYVVADDQIAQLAPELTGLTWATGSIAGTTKAAGLQEESMYKYVIGEAGDYAQPLLGDDAAELGYTSRLEQNTNLAVIDGQHIYVVEVDSGNRIVKWTDVDVIADQIAVAAPALTGFTWEPGSAYGTTKATQLPPGDSTYKYVVANAGAYTQPVVGSDAEALGYTLLLERNGNIAVRTGQHLYIVEVDSHDRIVKWTDIAVQPQHIMQPPISGSYVPSVPPQEGSGVAVVVNGETQANIATAHVTTANGKKTTTVTIDSSKLEAKLAESGQGLVVTIPVTDESAVVVGELNAKTVKQLEDMNAVLEVKTANAGYTLPAGQVNVSALSETFGSSVDLSDILIRVHIENVSGDAAFVPEQGGSVQGIAPVVNFRITAVYNGREVQVSQFNAYVERQIAIPEGIDPNKITTGVVLLADGMHHVPTKVIQTGGTYYAVMNSLTNSAYSVIYNDRTFGDINGHWAQAGIKEMASRLVLNGVTEDRFKPDNAVTRAEFAAMMVRALGLHTAKQPVSYSDVNTGDWYYNDAAIASSYGLLQGLPDGTFRPNRSITRQEAMQIAARAMSLAGAGVTLPGDRRNELLIAFTDADQFGGWAREAAALNIHYGIIVGMNGLIRPQDSISRAETAVMIQRLLQKANLINE